MIQFKTAEEIEIIKDSALILGKAHGEVAKHVKEGVKLLKNLSGIIKPFHLLKGIMVSRHLCVFP